LGINQTALEEWKRKEIPIVVLYSGE